MPLLTVRKPPAGAGVNRLHPLSQGITAAFALNEGSGTGLIELVNGLTGTLAGSTPPVWTPDQLGNAVQFNKGNSNPQNNNISYAEFGTPNQLANLAQVGTPTSWFVRFFLPAQTRGAVFGRGNGSRGWNVGANTFGDTGHFGLVLGFSVTTFVATINTPSTGVWHNMLVVWDGTATAGNTVIYIDGVPTGLTNTTNGSGTINDDSSDHFYLARSEFTFSASLVGNISAGYIWKNRKLTVLDAQALQADPWAPLRRTPSPPLTTYVFTKSASFSATMTARAATLGRKIFKTLTATKATFAGSLTAVKTAFHSFSATASQKVGSLVASLVPGRTLTAQTLLRSATLNRKVFKTISATKATFAGALSATKAAALKTLTATASTKAGVLSTKANIGSQLHAVKATFAGRLTMIVTHGPSPPVPTPTACPTIVPTISHVETCENTGS